jgi:hypothetical protein
MHQLEFDLPIERAVRAERCEGINLENEGLQLPRGLLAAGEDDVEAEDFEGERVLQVVRLAGPVDVLQVRRHRDDCLSYDVLDLGPQGIRVGLWLRLTDVLQDSC